MYILSMPQKVVWFVLKFEKAKIGDSENAAAVDNFKKKISQLERTIGI